MSEIRFTHDPFAEALANALLMASHGAGDPGEVTATAERCQAGDADAWVREWSAAGGAAWSDAKAADAAGRAASALDAFRRAAGHYAVAAALAPYSGEPERHLGLWRRQRTCWDRAVELLPVPGQRMAIPYADVSLPGCFFPASAEGDRRPLAIVVAGDGPVSHAWAHGGAAAAARGYHWMTFEGPGQGAALLEQGLTLRSDWEAVLTPVADAMLARDDVDADRIAVIGTGRAGWLVTRALTSEHRFTAAVADPGVLDLAAPWLAALPHDLRRLLACGDADRFERELHAAELFAPALTADLDHRGAPYVLGDRSRHRLFAKVASFRLDGGLERVRTPLLVTDPGDLEAWGAQPEKLVSRLPGCGELLQNGGRPAQRERDVLDWIDRHLA